MWPSFTDDAGTRYRDRVVPAPDRGRKPVCARPGMTALLLASIMLGAGCTSAPPRQQDAPAPVSDAVSPRVSPKELEPAFQAAIHSMQTGDWQAAATQLDAITAQDPRLPGAWVNLGITHVQLGNAATAETDFRHALEIDPKQAEAWNQLGMVYRRANRLAEAADAWQQALTADPDHADANWNLAILYDRYLTDPAQALAHYARYQQLTHSTDPQLQQWITALQEQLQAPQKMTAGAGK